MNKKIYIFLFILGTCLSPRVAFAQEKEVTQTDLQQDNLGNVDDIFQEYFFEALKQKAIGNHERAITALKKCISLQPDHPILYVELGTNYKALKQYPAAEKNLTKALEKRPESPYVRIELLEVYVATENYQEAVRTAKKLVDFDPVYYEDLANLYMMLKKPELALNALDTLDALKGTSENSATLRRRIFEATNDEAGQIEYLKTRIAQQPKNEETYIRLINLYGRNQQFDEAFSVAVTLQKIHPSSEKVHLALYQLYLNKGEYDKAIISIKKVLGGKDLEEATKMKVLQDFIAFTKEHPEYENELKAVLDLAMATGESMASKKELGDFYLDRDKAKALQYYLEALKNNFNDVETIENAVILQLGFQQYDEAAKLSENALAIFPVRPKLYLFRGIALNKLQEYQKALESLDVGLGYLIDDPQLESDFYGQMAIAYRGLLQEEKAIYYEKKATELKK